MKIREAGVISRDKMYFRTANLFTKENLLYILWGSIYLLDKPYQVKRNYMDAYMLQYIVEGELHFVVRGKEFIAKKDEIVILNCRELNHYWAEGLAKVKWFHFNGNLANALVDKLYEMQKQGHFNELYAKKVEPFINNIFVLLDSKDSSDFQISHNLYSILCELATPIQKVSLTEDSIKRAVRYMQDKYMQNISIKDVAENVGLSLFYFERLFKKYMNTSPRNFLVGLRIDNAKKLLTYTYYNVDQISTMVGFQSSSHFIRAFKKVTNMTPYKFRKYVLGKMPNEN